MKNLPEKIGRYEILGLLGTGGMAEVFLGRLHGPSGFERPVVIKRILPHLAREQQFVDMFLDEARIVANIRHQNVVAVHELGEDGDELFLVMEYLEGESLAGLARRLSRKRKLLSFGLCAHVLAEVCAGLHAAHEMTDNDGRPMSLVHRDVSPANIFVTYAGEVKILDFGIAVASDRVSKTEAGQVKGKYAYMSPEQCHGKDLDRRSDIFSLGTVLYELSTCRRLFKRSNDVVTIQAICNADAPSPARLVSKYPEELERVCMKALSRRRAERFQTASDMRRDLLGVSRNLNEGKIPEESLARVMHKLFMDRIEQKRTMLASIRDGREITSVPTAETDSQIELPAVPSASNPAIALDAAHEGSVSIGGASAVVRPSRKGWWVGAMAAALLVIAGTALLTTSSGGDANAVVAEAQEVPPSAPMEPKPPAPVAKVSLSIETDPAGADLRLAGESRGRTPLTLELDRTDQEVQIILSKPGYLTTREAVTLNSDLRVRYSMKRVARKVKPPKRTAKKKKKKKPVVEDDNPYTKFN